MSRGRSLVFTALALMVGMALGAVRARPAHATTPSENATQASAATTRSTSAQAVPLDDDSPGPSEDPPTSLGCPSPYFCTTNADCRARAGVIEEDRVCSGSQVCCLVRNIEP